MGRDISYIPSEAYNGLGKRSFVLCFTVEFEFAGDSEACFFAYCPPYTYTDLRATLGDLMSDDRRSQFVEREELCRTKAGNVVDLLTISR